MPDVCIDEGNLYVPLTQLGAALNTAAGGNLQTQVVVMADRRVQYAELVGAFLDDVYGRPGVTAGHPVDTGPARSSNGTRP